MHDQLAMGFYGTPPLWKKKQFGLVQFEMPRVDLSFLPKFDVPDKLRLGHQLEYVFAHLIANSKDYQLVKSNLHIDEENIRIGELDFILKRTEGPAYLHVEMAYKFYLIDPQITEPIYRLTGPNKRDMFYTKLDKLREKQLPLLHHSSLATYWHSLNCSPGEIEQKCCVKAQLFEPFGAEKVSIRPLNTACIAGRWIRFDDFAKQEFSKSQIYIPRKVEWVFAPHQEVGWINHYEALMEINVRMLRENTPMLWVRWPDERLEKLFVVWW